jgi:hypothetical protein
MENVTLPPDAPTNPFAVIAIPLPDVTVPTEFQVMVPTFKPPDDDTEIAPDNVSEADLLSLAAAEVMAAAASVAAWLALLAMSPTVPYPGTETLAGIDVMFDGSDTLRSRVEAACKITSRALTIVAIR